MFMDLLFFDIKIQVLQTLNVLYILCSIHFLCYARSFTLESIQKNLPLIQAAHDCLSSLGGRSGVKRGVLSSTLFHPTHSLKYIFLLSKSVRTSPSRFSETRIIGIGFQFSNCYEDD